jgi:poly-gamma-glutamate capsule biosynthesis protein CapA/YwtB (metallophosphatase superfamily)
MAACLIVAAGCAEKPELPPPPPAAAWRDGYRVLFVGDTYFGESYRPHDGRILRNGYDFGFAHLRPFLDAADLVVANLETPILDPNVTPPDVEARGYRHWTDAKEAPQRLRAYGFDAVSLGNNHALDQGVAGLEGTLATLARHEIHAFGAGLTQADAERPFEVDLRVGETALRLAVFAGFEYFKKYDTWHRIYARGQKPGVALLSSDRTASLVRDYKSANPQSFVVVFPHWGGNYAWKQGVQVPIATAVLAAGADAVIGHGAHTIQEIERLAGKTVVYNIGNFLFASRGRYEQFDVMPYGFAALLRFSTSAESRFVVDARLYAIATDNRVVEYQPRPATDAEFASLRRALMARSDAHFAKWAQPGKDSLGPFFEIRLR